MDSKINTPQYCAGLSYYATFDGAGRATAFYHEAYHGPKFKSVQVYVEGATLRDFPTVRWQMVPNPDCQIPADAVKISDEEWASYFLTEVAP